MSITRSGPSYPTTCESGCPREFKNQMSGIGSTPYEWATAASWSTSISTSSNLAASSANSCVLKTCSLYSWHGPHHTALKSTMIGFPLFAAFAIAAFKSLPQATCTFDLVGAVRTYLPYTNSEIPMQINVEMPYLKLLLITCRSSPIQPDYSMKSSEGTKQDVTASQHPALETPTAWIS